MPRVTPKETLDILGPLALKPDQRPEYFGESKMQNKFFVKPPNWDSAGDSIDLLACQNDRELTGMLQLQSEMRENNARQDSINRGRIHELTKIQTDLRQRFIEANNFFKDCDDKKKAAELKVFEEKHLHGELKRSIKENKKNITDLTEFKQVLHKTLDEFETYETVINQAVRENDVWTSVKDCIDRCDALMMAQVEICALKRAKIDEIEEMRVKIQQLTNEAALTVLGLNNELAELDRSYTQARMECLKWEKIIVGIKDVIITDKLHKCQILDGLQIMYRMLCKRRSINPILRRSDVQEMFDFVRDEISILQAVIKECTTKQRKIPRAKHR